jgi:hypothetical protein
MILLVWFGPVTGRPLAEDRALSTRAVRAMPGHWWPPDADRFDRFSLPRVRPGCGRVTRACGQGAGSFGCGESGVASSVAKRAAASTRAPGPVPRRSQRRTVRASATRQVRAEHATAAEGSPARRRLTEISPLVTAGAAPWRCAGTTAPEAWPRADGYPSGQLPIRALRPLNLLAPATRSRPDEEGDRSCRRDWT